MVFTIRRQVSTDEQVIHGFLALGLRQASGTVDDDFIRLFDDNPAHRFDFSSLGWTPQISTGGTFVGVLDLGRHLDKLQADSINVQVSDSTGVDWAIYTVAVATPIVPGTVKPSVSIGGGGSVAVESVANPIQDLRFTGVVPTTLKLIGAGHLGIQQYLMLIDSAELSIGLRGSRQEQAGRVVVGGVALLRGTLSVVLENDHRPAAGDTFQVLSAGTIVGRFDSVNLPALPSGLVWNVDDKGNHLVLSVCHAGQLKLP